MSRNKIPIQKNKDERIRNITYYKRKKGLIKKAMELSLLCDVDIMVGIYPKQISHNQLLIFCTTNNVDLFMDKYLKNPMIKKEVYGLKDVSKYNYK
jgi:MADS-box transcription factor